MATKQTKAKIKKPVNARAPRVAKRERPIFSMATWIMLGLFALVIAGFFMLKNRKETVAAEATPASETKFVFDAAEGTPVSIDIQPADGSPVKVVRSAGNVWSLELPEKAEANQGLIEQATLQLASLSVLGELENNNLATFGLDDPVHVITIKFSSGTSHILEVGDSTPTNSGYYVRLDKGKIMYVGLSEIDALTSLAFFPPYLNTPTPSPAPPTEAPIAPSPTPTP